MLNYKIRMLSAFLSVALIACAAESMEEHSVLNTENIGVSAEVYSGEDNGVLEYKIDNGQVTITKCRRTARTIIIPKTIEDLPVTALSDELFKGFKNLDKILIPEGVTNFGKNLFDKCTSLREINIPSTVTYIDEDMFDYCKSLENITVSESNSNYKTENGILFDKNITRLILCPEAYPAKTYVVPQSVLVIGKAGFESCVNIHSIVMDNVTQIEKSAFKNCIGLKGIVFSKSIESIGEDILKNLDLKKISIYANLGSKGYEYANENKISFVSLDDTLVNNKSDILNNNSVAGAEADIFSTVKIKQERMGIEIETAGTKVQSISVDKKIVTFSGIGQMSSIKIDIFPAHADNANVTFKSKNPSVATVSSDGVITAVGSGATTITAITLNGCIAITQVSVNIPAESLTLDKSETYLEGIGEKAIITADIAPLQTTDKAISWSSDNEAVARVDEKGMVTSIGEGTANITARLSNGIEATNTVTVKIPAVKVDINQTNAVLNGIGDIARLSATVAPQATNEKSITWTSSDESVAIVSGTGVVRAVGAGEAVVTASTSSGISSQCNVRVDIPMEILVFTEKEGYLNYEGQQYFIQTEIEPLETTDFNLIWKSSNPEVAEVDENGVVTAIANGKATIIAVSENGLTSAMTINVKIPKTDGIFIEGSEMFMPEVGSHLMLNVYNAYSDLKWSSDNEEVVTVSEDGVLTAVSKGEALITVTAANGDSDNCKIKVGHSINTIMLDNHNIELPLIGKTAALTAAISPSKLEDTAIKWISSNEEAVTVDQNGIVTAVGNGEATIMAITDNAIMDSCKVKVSVFATEISLNESTVNMTGVGDSKQLSATIIPENTTDKVIHWFSSNKDIVTVNGEGLITATGTGTAKVTAVTSNGKIAESKINVDYLEVNPDTVYDNIGNGDYSQEIEVKSNMGWRVETDFDWISIDSNGSSQDGSFKISLPANNTSAERYGTIKVISGDNQIKEIPVSQAYANTLDVPMQSIYDSNGNGEYYDIISFNTNTICNITTDSDWIILGNYSQSWNTLQSSLSVGLSKNNTGASRKGNIIITGGGMTKTIEVTQLEQVDNTIWTAMVTAEGGAGIKGGAFSSNEINAVVSEGEVVKIAGRRLVNGYYYCIYGNTEGYISANALTEYNIEGNNIELNVPSMKQFDETWNYISLGSYGQTIGEIGCTMTGVSMMESYRNQTMIYPDQMVTMLSFDAGGSLYWPSDYYLIADGMNYDAIYELLQEGKPVIIGGKNDYTTHWCVVYGTQNIVMGSDGNPAYLEASNFLIRDPGTDYRNTLEEYLNYCPSVFAMRTYS